MLAYTSLCAVCGFVSRYGTHTSQCPVESSNDLTAGVFLSAVLTQATAPAHRLAPEALSFLTSTIAQYCIRTSTAAAPTAATTTATTTAATKSSSSSSSSTKLTGKVLRALSKDPLPDTITDLIATPALLHAPLGWLRLAAHQWTAAETVTPVTAASETATAVTADNSKKSCKQAAAVTAATAAAEQLQQQSASSSSSDESVPVLNLRLGWPDDSVAPAKERSTFATAVLGSAYSVLSTMVTTLSDLQVPTCTRFHVQPYEVFRYCNMRIDQQ
jgi:peptidoglycan DL-endopeptidase CwlO